MFDFQIKEQLITLAALLRAIWPEIKGTLESFAILAVAVAAIMAMFRLRTIAQIVRDFRDSKGPIETIRSAVEKLEGVGELAPKIKDLGEDLKLLGEKIDAAQKQVAEQQRLTASERTEEAPPEIESAVVALDLPPEPTPALQSKDSRDPNWQKLREIWYKNTSRIEAMIADISDGRKKLKYDRMSRYQYEPIITALAVDGIITPAVAEASKKLNRIFLSYRPRNRPVPDEIVGVASTLGVQLETEMKLPPV